tara:strand:+ start:2554 stop:3219 length:666 start_codon:yes stop_codon:yes gene_type:complete
MNTLEKILNILKMKNEAKSYSVKFYAEMKLDDGRVVATEDEQFMIGSKVFVVGDDGEAMPLTKGEYTMENGNKLSIDDESRILDMGEDAEAEDIEAKEEEKEEMEAEINLEDVEKRLAALEKEIEEMKDKDKEEMSEDVKETKEEEKVEEVVEEKTEMSSEDVIGELMTQIEELNSKIVELNKQPAEEVIKYNPEGTNLSATSDLSKLSIKERAAYYINNK